MTTAYGTGALANAYWLERGVTSTISDADCLVASEWIDNNFGELFPGYKTGKRAQDREWPREAASDRDCNSLANDLIPDEVLRATYEVAYRNNQTPGSLNTDVTLGKNIVKAAVSGAVSVEYAGAADIGDLQLSIPVIGKILAPILTGDYDYSSLSAKSYRG